MPENTTALKHVRRWFGGLVRDVRRKLPHYASDYTDAFRLSNLSQIIGAVLFLYIVQLTNLVTYGTIMSQDITYGNNHQPEMVCTVGTLLARQPLASGDSRNSCRRHNLRHCLRVVRRSTVEHHLRNTARARVRNNAQLFLHVRSEHIMLVRTSVLENSDGTTWPYGSGWACGRR
jgi:hypothetical protein